MRQKHELHGLKRNNTDSGEGSNAGALESGEICIINFEFWIKKKAVKKNFDGYKN